MTGIAARGGIGLLAVLVVAPLEVLGDEPCLSLTRHGLEIAARNFGLDADQLRWMMDAFAAGRLLLPADLEGWPGVGPELRDAVAASFCWDRPPKGQISVGEMVRTSYRERRGTLEWYSTRAAARLRVRARTDETSPLVRGGGMAGSGGWHLAGGFLEARRGLGLALQTAGTEVRGTAPRSVSSRRFEVALGSDSWTPKGGSLGIARGAWTLDLAGLFTQRSDASSWTGAGIVEQRGGAHRTTLTALVSEGKLTASVSLMLRAASGDWAMEVARGARGGAAAMAGSAGAGGWRVRGSLAWRGKGYSSPLARGWEATEADAEVHFVTELRWSSGRGRYFRASHSDTRTPDEIGFPVLATWTELEAGERLARGVELSVLWRGTGKTSPGIPQSEENSQAIRGEARLVRGGVEARARIDQRLESGGSRALHLGLGRSRDPWSWEIRAVRFWRTPGAEALRVYFRRAGDLVGWTTAPVGTTLGGWIRGRWGGWTVEVSGDGGAGIWSWTAGVRRGFGGAP